MLGLKRLDWYLMKKFLMTFFLSLVLIIGIVIIFDISEKIDDFVSKEAPLHAIIFDYYLNWIPYFMNMFSPLFVFISVIFFTSIMAANSEIIAILSCGISYHRMMVPYLIGDTHRHPVPGTEPLDHSACQRPPYRIRTEIYQAP